VTPRPRGPRPRDARERTAAFPGSARIVHSTSDMTTQRILALALLSCACNVSTPAPPNPGSPDASAPAPTSPTGTDAGTPPVANACPGWGARCRGRACGDDGFGGSCGACAAGTRCSTDGQCVGCTPQCNGKACGDDGCGGTCGSCSQGTTCSLGECIAATIHDADELSAIQYINAFRVSTQPRPTSCTTNPDLDKPQTPVRLNADMVENSRLNAQHIIDWEIATGQGQCAHYDPIDQVGSLGDRLGGFLGSQGCQNIWCGAIAPQDSPITGDPGHCECMLYGETDWGIASVTGPGGQGTQVQDPATDSAYLPVLLDLEAPTTTSPTVDVYVRSSGFPGFVHVGNVTDVEMSESPCFENATWQPYSDALTYTFDPKPGRKQLWVRVKDDEGQMFVTWDSIFLGAMPDDVDTLKEGIRRIRSVRVPPIAAPGFDAFEYSLGQHIEMEDTQLMGLWWGTRTIVDDPDASGGKAVGLDPGGLAYFYTGGNSFPPMEGEIHVRMKSASNTSSSDVAWATWREDTGGLVGGLAVKGTDFVAPNQYQWFRVPFVHVASNTLFYFEFSAGPGVLVDKFEVWSKPIPLSETTTGGGMTLDFTSRNYRGIEIQTQLLDTATGKTAAGPTINPYCSLCGN
jgi:hypothetical protein